MTRTAPKSLSEHEIQQMAVEVVRLAGLTVLETTAYRQKGASGVDLGIPDLLVSVPGSPALWIGIEMKKPGGTLSNAQFGLSAAGQIVVCHSPLEVLRSIRDAFKKSIPQSPYIARVEKLMEAL